MLPAATRVLADGEALAAEASRLIGAAARAAIGARKLFRIVLAGGATPARAYRLLAETAQDWASWEVFWGDERCLPVDHPERNARLAGEAWLCRVAIPKHRIHPIAVERGAGRAAADYAELIEGKLPFDLVVLGMGEDGHTASLFAATPDAGAPVIAVGDAPKPPAERVSLAYRTLRECRSQLVLVSGAAKAGALAAWRRGDNLPIARAVRDDACLLLDQAVCEAAGIASPGGSQQ